MAATNAVSLMRHVLRLVGGGSAAPDGVLLERFRRERDEGSFAEVVRRHGPLVWGVCRRVLRHEQDAEDAFQATFLVLARKAGSVRDGAALAGWLFGVAHRLALKQRQARDRREQFVPPSAPPGPDPCDEVTWRELRGALDEELALLPDRLRTPLLLCYFEGLTQDEAARQLGWKPCTFKARLGRARERLRRRLGRRGLTLSAALVASVLAGSASTSAPAAALVETTARAAPLFALGRPAGGAVPLRVLALAEGGLRAMFLSKLPAVVAALVATAILAGAAGLLLSGPFPPPRGGAPAPEDKDKAGKDAYGDPLPAGAIARLGTVRFRHGGFGLKGLAFLADGKTLVTTSDEGRDISFWDAATGKLLREISTGDLSVRCFAASPDGSRVAVGGFLPFENDQPIPGAVRVYDTDTGKEVKTLKRESQDVDVARLAFAPGGKLLASLGNNGALRIEEVGTGLEILQQRVPADVSPVLAFSPDGATLAVWTGPNTHKLLLWKWQAGEEPRDLQAPRYSVQALAFSPDGKLLATLPGSQGPLRLWDVATGKVVQALEPPRAERHHFSHGLAFSPDGKTLAASGQRDNRSGAIHLWDMPTGRYRGELEAAAGWLAISPDSKLIAAAGGNDLRVWELATGKEPAFIDEAHRDHVGQVVVCRDGLAATASDDGTVRVWDLKTGRQKLRLAHEGSVRGLALSPDGTRLASSSFDDRVRLWDLKTGRVIYELPGHGRLGGRRALGFTADGKRLLSWGDDWYLRAWDVANGKAVLDERLKPTGVKVPDLDGDDHGWDFPDVGGTAFSPDGRAFVLHHGPNLFRFDAATGKEVGTIQTNYRSGEHLVVSPDGKRVLLAGWGQPIETRLPNGQVRSSMAKDHPLGLWDLAGDKLVREVSLPGSWGGALAFSADGKTFAAAVHEPERAIRLWDAATGDELPAITGLRHRVTALGFSPDGKYLVSALDDTTALVWDLTNPPPPPKKP